MVGPPPYKLDNHARALIRAGVQALPATFHEFLVVKGGSPQDEVHLLAVLRMLFVLTVFEADGDEDLLRPLMSARSGILGLPDPDTPPLVPSGGYGAAYGQSYGGTGEERRPFAPYDAVSLADEACMDVTGRWGSTPRPDDPNTGHTTIAENARYGALTEQDEQYERELEQLGDGASKWTWWVQWRREYLDGKLPDRSIGRFIAQIDREDWEAGPDRVGRLIESFTRRGLQQRLADFEEAEEVIAVDRHGEGGNFPPGPINDLEEIVSGLRFETGKQTPDRSAVARWVKALRGWLGPKLDKATDAYAEELGKQAARITMAGIVALAGAILLWAKSWLATLPALGF